jgi:hypothetical protein
MLIRVIQAKNLKKFFGLTIRINSASSERCARRENSKIMKKEYNISFASYYKLIKTVIGLQLNAARTA